jgi:hypothetical protein
MAEEKEKTADLGRCIGNARGSSIEFWRTAYFSKIGNKDFIDGLLGAIWWLARWVDGRQVVGVLEDPYELVVHEIKIALEYPEV